MIRVTMERDPQTMDAELNIDVAALDDTMDRLRPVVGDMSRLWTNKIRDLVSRKIYPPASRPGEPPARRTGQLMRGFQTIPTEVRGSARGFGDIEMVGGVRNEDAPYANILDRGGRRRGAGGRVFFFQARPYSVPALVFIMPMADARARSAIGAK